MSRPSWDETFIMVARVMAMRSPCTRRQVGAVIMDEHHTLVAAGYNGQPAGMLHCDEGGCPRGQLTHDQVPRDADYNQYPCTAIHAEANALLRAGPKARGCTMYVTEKPCQQCVNLIAGAGIETVIVWSGENGSVHPGGSGADALHPEGEAG